MKNINNFNLTTKRGENNMNSNKKMNKKKIFVVALAVCLLAIISFSTLAWFTAQDSVTNEFYVGDSNTDPDKVFGVDVWETVDGEEKGRGTANDGGAVYEDILPGQILSKAPVVENTGIHPMYVRAIVTVSPASILKDAMGDAWKNVDLFLAGNDETQWLLDNVVYVNDGTDSKFVYTYYYQSVLEPERDNANGYITPAIFDAVVIPTGLTTDMAAQLEDFEIDILGQAIQSEHILSTNAKDAFETYWEGVPVYNASAEKSIAYVNANITEPITTEANNSFTSLYIEDSTASGEAMLVVGEPNYQTQISNVTADVDNLVILEHESTVIIENSNITLHTGGKIVVNNSSAYTCQIILSNVTVNGTLVTEANKYDFFDNNIAMIWIYND